jgi:hypothetical protein
MGLKAWLKVKLGLKNRDVPALIANVLSYLKGS